MAKEKYKYLPIQEDNSDIDLRKIVHKYIRFWPWYVITTLIFLFFAICYIKYAPSQYTSVASIIVNNEKNNGGSRSNTGYDVNMFNGLSTNSMANELSLLTSKRLMDKTIKALELHVQYLDESGFITQPIYKASPFKVTDCHIDDRLLWQAIKNKKNIWKVENIGNGALQLVNSESEAVINTRFNNHIELGFAEFEIIPNEWFEPLSNNWTSVTIKFLPIKSVSDFYSQKLQVNLIDENATLIQLKLTDRVPEKAEDILNELIRAYNEDAIKDKNLIAKNTAEFIDRRLNIINMELDSVESGKESFKKVNRLTDIGDESTVLIQNVNAYKKQQQQVDTELDVTNSMLNFLDSDSEDLLPANLGFESKTNEFVNKYNDLILERNRLLTSSTDRSPLVLSLNRQILQLRNNIKQSLLNKRRNLIIQQSNLRKQTGLIGSQIARMPGQERQVRGIERQQSIKESLYLFLLQKREENTLELSVTGPKAKIVDHASSSGGSISPSPKIVLGVALILGILLPVIVIRGKELLNGKINSKEDLVKIDKDIPVLGELPSISKKEAVLIKANDRTVLAETFRILTANLQFLIEAQKKSGCVSIFVTSTIKGEGKTFVSTNLAITLALTGKKVVLIGGDLRNPQLHRYQEGLDKTKGVSDYLANDQQNLGELLKKSELNKNLMILPSGTVPPNPAELLQSKRLSALFLELESSFDYIIVDTAPALQVADTLLITKYADLTFYVARAGFTDGKLMDFALEANRKGKLKNLSFILNGVSNKNLGYGSNYGYTYGD
ncbi:GumC family protein [Algibacter mikhailovii]|uniref:GumC family protein n=1 Tax=Algibacter mikhailovii TaxID=425498 RepID=UPI0024953A2C|nr:polysaccharide biosynthesis tyrosine autokinase [Algibacter mikhailovii]